MKTRMLEILSNPFREFDNLTNKEKEIARLASRGLLNHEIAEDRKTSTYAVAAVMRSIFNKIGMNKTDLIKHLIKQIDELLEE